MVFSRNKIDSEEESLAEKMKDARDRKGLSLEEAATRTNINQYYLELMEAGKYNKLPGGVYQKTYIKKYASFLGLKSSDWLKGKKEEKNDVFARKTIRKSALLVFPKIFRNTLAIVAVLALFLYIGLYLRNSLSRPELEIFEPIDDLITEKNSITVSGKAEEKTLIEINDRPILKKDDGTFSENVELKKGLNVISISAQNKYSQKRVIKKQILVK